MKQVTNNRLISQYVLVPCLLAGYFIRFPLRFCLLNVGFLLLLVKIFGHEVKNSIDAFLRVVLTVPLKSHIILAKDSLEQIRSDYLRVIDPHLAYQFGPRLHKPAFSSEWVLVLSVDQGLVSLLQKILC